MRLLLFFFPVIIWGNPSLKIRLNRQGWDFLKESGLRMMERDLPNMRLPNHEEKKSYKLELYDMQIDGMHRPKIHYTLTHDGISIKMEGMNLWGHGTFRISKRAIFKFATRGRIDVHLSNIQATGNVRFGFHQHRPQVFFEHCNARVQNVKLDFHGTSAWIIKLFNGYLNNKARREINKQACQYLQEAVADANAKLLSIPLHFDLNGGLSLDYQFQHMVHNSEYTETSLVGSVTMGGSHCPIHSAPMDEGPDPGPFMTTILASEHLASCVLESAHTAGFIKDTITKDSNGSEKYLRTSSDEKGLDKICVGTFFPDLGKKYPNQHVDAVVYSNAPPKLLLNNGASLVSSLTLDFFLHPITSNPNKLASLEINSKSNLFVKAEEAKLKVDVKNTTVELRQVYSEIGQLDQGFLSSFENLIASFEELMLNIFFQSGIPMPVFREAAMAVAANPSVSIGNGFVRVDANFVHH